MLLFTIRTRSRPCCHGYKALKLHELINFNRFTGNNRTHNLFLANFDHHLSCNSLVVLWLSIHPELENDGLISAVVKFKLLNSRGLEFKPRCSRQFCFFFFSLTINCLLIYSCFSFLFVCFLLILF